MRVLGFGALFARKSGGQSVAQSRAFHDTWCWGRRAEGTYSQGMGSVDPASDAMRFSLPSLAKTT